MNSAVPPLPPPSNPALLPVLATGTYLATVVALWGVLSLLLDREVIDYPDAGPLLGPAMAAFAVVVTWLFAWRSRHPWWGMLLATVTSWLGMLAVAAIGYGNAPVLDVVVHFALSPFVAGAAVLSGLTVLGMAFLRRHPSR